MITKVSVVFANKTFPLLRQTTSTKQIHMDDSKLIEILDNHILNLIQQIPKYQLRPSEASYKEIEEATKLALNLLISQWLAYLVDYTESNYQRPC